MEFREINHGNEKTMTLQLSRVRFYKGKASFKCVPPTFVSKRLTFLHFLFSPQALGLILY